MKPMTFMIVALFLILGVPGFADPIDPDPDGMSVYFDLEATTYALYVDDWEPAIGAGPTIPAYLMITRPEPPYSFPGIQAWEAHIEIETNSYTPPTGWLLTSGFSDFDGDPDDYLAGGCMCVIPFTGPAILIASVELNWLGTEGHAEAEFFLSGIEGSLSFPEGPGYCAGPVSRRPASLSSAPGASVHGSTRITTPSPTRT